MENETEQIPNCPTYPICLTPGPCTLAGQCEAGRDTDDLPALDEMKEGSE